MSYRRNCNHVASSLRRCCISGVCFAFQLAALWKRHLCVFVLGKFHLNSQRGTAEPSRTQRILGRRGKWTSSSSPRPKTVRVLFLFPVKTTELLPPGDQNAVTNQSKQSIDGSLVDRSISQLGFDRYGTSTPDDFVVWTVKSHLSTLFTSQS